MPSPLEDLLDLPIDQAPTVVLDFETTGLSPANDDRICEIAAVRKRPDGQGRKPKRVSALVNPGKPMPAVAQSIHGISDAELADAPDFSVVLPRLARALDGAVVVAHSAAFDVGFLRSECHRLGVPSPSLGPIVCTLAVSRQLFGFSRCSLAALAQRMNVPQPRAHRAMADVQVTWQVYQAMLADIGRDAMPTVRQLLERTEGLAKGAPLRVEIARRISEAASTGQKITIDYTAREGNGPLTVRRAITVHEARLPYIDAWCHLRREERQFHIRRVQRIVD